MKKFLGVIAALVFSVGAISMGVVQANAAEQERVSDGNDSYETATYLDVNGSVTDTIMDNQDVDFFRLSPNANGAITVSFQHTYKDSSGNGWNIDIYKYENGEYKEVSSSRIQLTDNENIQLPFIGVTAGSVYYVKISRYWDCIGEGYTLRSTFEASQYYEQEKNDSYAAATIVQMNETYTGTIGTDEDEDFYKIDVSTAGKLIINFEHTYKDYSGNGWNVDIYKYENGEYKELSSSRIQFTDNENMQLPFIGTNAGSVYYIKISRYWDSIGDIYKISNTFQPTDYCEKEINDSYETATDLSINQTYQGVLNNNDDEDFWRISAPKSGLLGIYFGHLFKDSYDGWNAYVYQYIDGEYRELSNCTIRLNDRKSLKLVDISVNTNGTYYVKIKNNYGAVAEDYQLNVKYVAEKPSYLRGNTRKNTVTLLWESVKGADGYEVYCKKSKGTTYRKIADTARSAYNYKKLSKKMYTYFKVRSYVKNGNEKVYSKFSYVVKVRA